MYVYVYELQFIRVVIINILYYLLYEPLVTIVCV